MFFQHWLLPTLSFAVRLEPSLNTAHIGRTLPTCLWGAIYVLMQQTSGRLTCGLSPLNRVFQPVATMLPLCGNHLSGMLSKS